MGPAARASGLRRPHCLALALPLFVPVLFKSGRTNLETARKAVTVRLDREEPREGLDIHAAAARTEGWTRGDLRWCVDDVVRMAAGHPPSSADLDVALAARERVRGLIRAEPA